MSSSSGIASAQASVANGPPDLRQQRQEMTRACNLADWERLTGTAINQMHYMPIAFPPNWHPQKDLRVVKTS
jgi:hypothetical protein